MQLITTYCKKILNKLYIARFYLLTIVLVIYLISQFVNIKSIRNNIEAQVERTFHRQILFSHLFLSFNLKGIYIGVDNLKILDLDKTVFLNSKKAQVGIELKPLIKGKIKIKFLSFSDPTIHANRISNKIWNFSDLLDVKTYANFFEIKNAKVYFHDLLPVNNPNHFKDCLTDKVFFNYSINKRNIDFHSTFELIKENNDIGYISTFGTCYPLLKINTTINNFSKDSISILTQLINQLPGNLIPTNKLAMINEFNKNLTEFKLKSMVFKVNEISNLVFKFSCKSDFELFTIDSPKFGLFHVRNFKSDANLTVDNALITVKLFISPTNDRFLKFKLTSSFLLKDVLTVSCKPGE